MKMNKLLQPTLIIAMVLLIAVAGSAQPKKTGKQPAGDAEFTRLIEGYYAAWSTLNTDNADKYYAKDADLVFYDIAPLKYKNWAEYKQTVQTTFLDTLSSGKLVPNMDDLRITRRGTIAWTTVTFHLTGTPKAGGNSMEIDARHTAIWEKRGGRWLIVHEHVSAPLPG
jgi:ketosteroid isomerase-like protein